MAEKVIVDAGPLVAVLRQDDLHHEACRAASQQVRLPLITTWLAVTEAAWLLRRVPNGVPRLVAMLQSDLVRCHDLDSGFLPWLQNFLQQYADLDPQIADASLVYTADAVDCETIFTLDRRDFVVFRNKQKKAFRLLPETA